ncbi:hypothetical protein CONPUDRAFT_135918 [Coniophora puteana RWD-64-598 SS2]|uniref:Uncharacterized protein n=1 Tax=Coniophora puteana (strain RWD-64-598) TaxID=741705 RepID=A0A5M3MZL0_CONPW|nr:uncharacterized protein CONPUDRAFT_135918 [Coniophora puteana RWD-64-598 SS2]EIW84568.1 hypothetical protein CONPUDRAFT_135918 [Coniophora puteana RWD-64-598 SS2]
MNGTAAAPRKRKYAGEKQPGGLVIVRAGPRSTSAQPSVKPPSTSQTTAKPPSSSQPKPASQPVNSSLSSTSFVQSTSTSTSLQPNGDLNARPPSRAASTQPQPVRASSKQPQLGHRAPSQHPASSSMLVPTQPPHEYEQQPRVPPQTPRQQNPAHARRSSMSARGKRASSSFENTGAVPHPHNTVADSAFYKHIDAELPEALRAQQLLIWAAGRAMSRLSSSVSSSRDHDSPVAKRQKTDKGKASANGKDPPPASVEEEETVLEVLRRVHEDVIHMLAEGRIDTRVTGASSRDLGAEAGKERDGFRANDQNVKNQAREVRFKEHIERAKNEFDAWSRVDHFYTSYSDQTSADLEKRRASLLPPSAKARGKQRAASQEPPNPDDEWEWMIPRPEDMAPEFKEEVDLELVQRVMRGGTGTGTTSKSQKGQKGHRPIPAGGAAERIQDLRFRSDALWAHASAAAQTADKAQRELDLRFSLLGQALDRARALNHHHQPQPADGSASLVGFVNVASSSSLRRSATDPIAGAGTAASTSQARSIAGGDPLELFRALSRVDSARPPVQMGDAARRAVRAVQRVQEGGGLGAGERKMVGVPPSTPRKGGLGGVGTPRSLRKSSTKDRERG